MQSIPPPGPHGSQRLSCARCGITAVAGDAAWQRLTSTSHSGTTVAEERLGHAVGMDLCRDCLRATLRGMLGMRAQVLPSFGGGGRLDADGSRQDCRPDRRAGQGVEQRAAEAHQQDRGRAQRAVRSMERTDAFVRASQRRLQAWRRADADGEREGESGSANDADGADARLQVDGSDAPHASEAADHRPAGVAGRDAAVGQARGRSASASRGAAASLGASNGHANTSAVWPDGTAAGAPGTTSDSGHAMPSAGSSQRNERSQSRA